MRVTLYEYADTYCREKISTVTLQWKLFIET